MLPDLAKATFTPIVALDPVVIQIIALVAGAIIAGAAIPKVWSRIKRARKGTEPFAPADLWRDACVGIGNGIWVIFGLATGYAALTFFCAVQVPLMAALVMLNLRDRQAKARLKQHP